MPAVRERWIRPTSTAADDGSAGIERKRLTSSVAL
jgi:hypothetical protein